MDNRGPRGPCYFALVTQAFKDKWQIPLGRLAIPMTVYTASSEPNSNSLELSRLTDRMSTSSKWFPTVSRLPIIRLNALHDPSRLRLGRGQRTPNSKARSPAPPGTQPLHARKGSSPAPVAGSGMPSPHKASALPRRLLEQLLTCLSSIHSGIQSPGLRTGSPRPTPQASGSVSCERWRRSNAFLTALLLNGDDHRVSLPGTRSTSARRPLLWR